MIEEFDKSENVTENNRTQVNVIDLIDEEDRAFCQRQQEKFNRLCATLPSSRELMGESGSFVGTILRYFVQKYELKLDDWQIALNMLSKMPKEPEKPDLDDFSEMTDGEKAAAEIELEEYEQMLKENEQILRNSPIRYEQILDEIFSQIGGSFDKAERRK